MFFFICFLRLRFVLSIFTMDVSAARRESLASSRPNLARVSCQSTRFPTRFTTRARLSCLAASASASAVATGGLSMVPIVEACATANGDSASAFGDASGADSNSAEVD